MPDQQMTYPDDLTAFLMDRRQNTKLKADGLRTMASLLPPATGKVLSEVAALLDGYMEAEWQIGFALERTDALDISRRSALEDALEALATVHADHEDYQPDWRPEAWRPGDI